MVAPALSGPFARPDCRLTVRRRCARAIRAEAVPGAASGATEEDRAWMRRALALAARGAGATHPNPAVGCVIVAQGGEVVGEGYHPRAGLPHAEVYALRAAGRAAAGATAYVTLEPCAHHGRTPPCARALVAARVGRVVVGCADPNPLVGGRGIETLRAAGIEVTVGCEEQACFELNAEFMARMAAAVATAA
eukprot:scaffold1.g5408.t1